jgi:hypothetical protein
MIILHDADLIRIFHDEFSKRTDKIQEKAITPATDEHEGNVDSIF